MDGVTIITGVSAAGKSTVAQLLAERFDRSVHVKGDVFRRMVVGGREAFAGPLGDEAVRQLRLRYRLSAHVADRYCEAGFTTIVQDVIVGRFLAEYVELVTSRPRRVVVLAPAASVVARREEGRAKSGYTATFTPEAFDDGFRAGTPRIGLWLDTSEQTPEQTVDEIVARADEGLV